MENQGMILPIYFVADESGSMSPWVNELNDGLTSLLEALQHQPFAASKVRLSVIGFAEDAKTYLEVADTRTLQGMPVLRARGARTSFMAAFDQLGYRISVDIPALKALGFLVTRPAVFFLTDGGPYLDEDWRGAYRYLMSKVAAPNILAFGIGEADPANITYVATKPNSYAFIAASGADTGWALAEFINSLTQSIVSSGQALSEGAAELRLANPDGFAPAAKQVSAAEPGRICASFSDGDAGGPVHAEVSFLWKGNRQASFEMTIPYRFEGTVGWPDGLNVELRYGQHHFLINGAAPTADDPASDAGMRDLYQWYRLAHEIVCLISNEAENGSSDGEVHGKPQPRASSIIPYQPTY
jgi:uncharacterized protein YegL